VTSPAPPTAPIPVKVCGLTRPEEALGCVRLGAAAIGLVFYPRSPRCVSTDQARAIARRLPPETRLVGVFVNPDYETVMERVATAGLWGVQLHGQEAPELVARVKATGTAVFKALFRHGDPSMEAADRYDPTAFLVESGTGPLPGGNAESWGWAEARALSERRPVLLAGGLSPENVVDAAAGARADAVDVSSGVEERPGRKDLDRVACFMEAVGRIRPAYTPRRVFG
jgi:phosphoribosylanthranilate isomerase